MSVIFDRIDAFSCFDEQELNRAVKLAFAANNSDRVRFASAFPLNCSCIDNLPCLEDRDNRSLYGRQVKVIGAKVSSVRSATIRVTAGLPLDVKDIL